jgi:hypothetical protein
LIPRSGNACRQELVKLPRFPIDDNLAAGDMPLYRDLWQALKDRGLNLPRKGAAGELDPLTLFNEIQTALYSLYSHYKKTFNMWEGVIETPPVFIGDRNFLCRTTIFLMRICAPQVEIDVR